MKPLRVVLLENNTIVEAHKYPEKGAKLARVKALLAAGKGHSHIAKALNISKNASRVYVYKNRDRLGLGKHPINSVWHPENVETAKKILASGGTKTDVIKKLQLSKGQLQAKHMRKLTESTDSLGTHLKKTISSFRTMRKADKALKAYRDAAKKSGAKWGIDGEHQRLQADVHHAATIHLHHAKEFGDKLFGRSK